MFAGVCYFFQLVIVVAHAFDTYGCSYCPWGGRPWTGREWERDSDAPSSACERHCERDAEKYVKKRRKDYWETEGWRTARLFG